MKFDIAGDLTAAKRTPFFRPGLKTMKWLELNGVGGVRNFVVAGDLTLSNRTRLDKSAGDFRGRPGDLAPSNLTPFRILSGAGLNDPRVLNGTDLIGLYGKGQSRGGLWTSIDIMDAVSGSSSIGVHASSMSSLRTFHFPVCEVG